MLNHLDVWKRCEEIAPQLSRSLAEFEASHRDRNNSGSVEGAILTTWCLLIADAKDRKVSLSSIYLSTLHSSLEGSDSIAFPAEFREGNSPEDWSTFLSGIHDANGESICGAEAWVLAQLSWGNHVPSMSFSLGWLAFNGLRLQEGLYPVCPPRQDSSRLAAALAAAGPPCWDSETLRELIGEYDRNQSPDA